MKYKNMNFEIEPSADGLSFNISLPSPLKGAPSDNALFSSPVITIEKNDEIVKVSVGGTKVDIASFGEQVSLPSSLFLKSEMPGTESIALAVLKKACPTLSPEERVVVLSEIKETIRSGKTPTAKLVSTISSSSESNEKLETYLPHVISLYSRSPVQQIKDRLFPIVSFFYLSGRTLNEDSLKEYLTGYDFSSSFSDDLKGRFDRLVKISENI